jgi:ketosteroid isomerase-like protein
MSQENVEVVRLAFEAWNRDDLAAALLLIDSNAEWRGPGDLFIGIESVFRGHAGVRKWWKANKEPWEYFKSHIERTLEDGDKVVAVVRFEAVGRESGVKVELPLINVFELRDGLIVKFTAYRSLEEALEAVGLSEQDAHADS